MLAISLTPVEIDYLKAIMAKRRPSSLDAWNKSINTLKHLNDLGLIAFHNNLVVFHNTFDLTSLGRDTLKMHREKDFDTLFIHGQKILRFYY